jgi:hypothetical protein
MTGKNSRTGSEERDLLTKLKLTICVAIVLSAATMLYLGKTMVAQGTAQTITVTITPNPAGKPSVNPYVVDLDRAKDQQVVWTCSSGCDFEVIFPPTGTPFKGNTFSRANPKSGVPVARDGKYPYVVKVDQKSVESIVDVH